MESSTVRTFFFIARISFAIRWSIFDPDELRRFREMHPTPWTKVKECLSSSQSFRAGHQNLNAERADALDRGGIDRRDCCRAQRSACRARPLASLRSRTAARLRRFPTLFCCHHLFLVPWSPACRNEAGSSSDRFVNIPATEADGADARSAKSSSSYRSSRVMGRVGDFRALDAEAVEPCVSARRARFRGRCGIGGWSGRVRGLRYEGRRHPRRRWRGRGDIRQPAAERS